MKTLILNCQKVIDYVIGDTKQNTKLILMLSVLGKCQLVDFVQPYEFD